MRFSQPAYVVLVACALIGQVSGAAAQTRTYLTLDKALERALGPPGSESAPDSVGSQRLRLDIRKVETLAADLAMRVLDREYVFYEAWVNGNVTRRAVVINTIGQYQPITYLVTTLPNGIVERVDLMVYRESRGSEVRRPAFLRQFEQKSATDPIAVHRDITHITGATISSRSIAAGVRLALRLQQMLPARPGSKEGDGD